VKFVVNSQIIHATIVKKQIIAVNSIKSNTGKMGIKHNVIKESMLSLKKFNKSKNKFFKQEKIIIKIIATKFLIIVYLMQN
jgi:hypothetical protein